MMEKDKLRKADIFSGSIFFLVGLWIVYQAFKMPMTDSYGGVQNVWYVSPAIFPLLVGAMITLLGALLTRTAIKEVGIKALGGVFGWLFSTHFLQYLKTTAVIRFYAMSVLFMSYIYLNIPRIDFFLCSILFLVVFITIFYLDDEVLLLKTFILYLFGSGCFVIFFITGLSEFAHSMIPFAGDWLMIGFIIACCIYPRTLITNRPAKLAKYRLSLSLAFAAPLIVGVIFKYLLLVPMPTEGLVVTVMDAIRYWDF